ncbi:hypothetical protein POSPLADRAFT_1043638 [Postia placenta MAD-698-R-SB12]|uniref:Uncharacterized protein n=1 Tax=Postia placenta MAD-698-R-SB12 TaxID=670580 RepID=A0A1X6NCB3_9APHY|nr:hypothetical protein POSPLADRAFT_1043638 [Postia placenta MAD-698-R-SB12]OSX66150.1 hypothetical protein POSPLADRAFT_1043638 [Postia placenta MAD-698-R-SB12]
MSRSTTATTTYNLVKYSRSYPQAAGSDQLDQEWQHFTNPVIRLVVDVKKASSGDLENFRTRILWTLQASNDCMDVDQREVVFEDLDLLAFSSIPLLKDRIITSQGLPLKAVYRDAVIGIRYLHPRIVPAGATPSYRRFQITFQSASQATCFIESIKFVCPCKANQVPPVSRTINRAATMVQASVMGPPVGDTASGIPRPSVPPGFGRMQVPHGSSMSSHLSFAPETPSQQRDVLLSSATQRPWDQPPPFNACTPVTSLLPRSSTASSERQRLPINTSVSPWDSSSTNLSAFTHSEPSHISMASSENSYSRQETLSLAPTAPSPTEPIPAPIQQTAAKENISPTSQRILACLEETPSLYDLSRGDLEEVVAKVVREEGFLKLLEQLDSMWKIKSVLDLPCS